MTTRRVLLTLLILGTGMMAHAATYPATTCSQADVSSAIAKATTGDTVTVPGGNCTWSSHIIVSKDIIIQGAGQGQTNLTLSGSDWLLFTVPGGKKLRLTGFSVAGGGSTRGLITMNGAGLNFRMDHMTFRNITQRVIWIGFDTWYLSTPTAVTGLIDHITFTSNVSNPFAMCYGDNNEWLRADEFGTARAVYVEDSSFTYSATWNANNDVFDAEHGCRYVVRHNTMMNASILGHDTGSTQQSRGQKNYEIYANTMDSNDVGNVFEAISLRGGTGVVYDNNIYLQGSHGFETAFFTEVYRAGQPGGDPWTFPAGGGGRICSNFRSHCSGGDHRSCGVMEDVGSACGGDVPGGSGTCTNYCTSDADCPSGTACLTSFDGTGTSGYPVRDQTGVGGADGSTAATHAQQIHPVYHWNNVDPNTKAQINTVQVASADSPYIKQNREFFTYTSSFNGTSGVGRGLLSARPSTCTANVAYWATDTNTLYKCTSTNTWATYYQPYTYPHPLQGAALPEPPTQVQGVGR